MEKICRDGQEEEVEEVVVVVEEEEEEEDLENPCQCGFEVSCYVNNRVI